MKENTGCASSIFDGLPFPQDLDFECPRGAKSVYPGSSPPAPAPQIVAVARAARAGPRERKCAKAWCAADYHGDPRARGGAHAVSVPPSGTSLPHPLGLSLSLSLSLARAHGVNETLTSFSLFRFSADLRDLGRIRDPGRRRRRFSRQRVGTPGTLPRSSMFCWRRASTSLCSRPPRSPSRTTSSTTG